MSALLGVDAQWNENGSVALRPRRVASQKKYVTRGGLIEHVYGFLDTASMVPVNT